MDTVTSAMPTSAPPGSILDRLLGAGAVAGGLALIVVFLPNVTLSADVNTGRLVLFNLGAVAGALAAARSAAPEARFVRLAAAAVIIANAAHAAMSVIAATLDRPFAGDFGLAYFWIALAMWLTDATFGLAMLRSGGPRRWGPLALGVGSMLAILGMGRLGLTSPQEPTIFGPIALFGIFLNGVGWIMIGRELVIGSPWGRERRLRG